MFVDKNILLLGIRYMGIDFGRTDGAVSQHFLDIPYIHILFQQESGKGMPEHMGRNMLADTGLLRIPVYHKTDGLVRKLSLQPVYKEISAGFDIGGKGFSVQMQRSQHFRIAYLQNPFLRTFAVNKNRIAFQIHV